MSLAFFLDGVLFVKLLNVTVCFMRLTLRTLLAYRDHVLNPNELDDLHKRVQQSEMAGKLLRRIDSLGSRQNILAPRIDGRGLGGDANTIAEYLDDTLQSEKVPELERICLESDIQLAELADCHRILATALHHSDEIPQALFQRVVALSLLCDVTANQKPQHLNSIDDGTSGRWRTIEEGLQKRIDPPRQPLAESHVAVTKITEQAQRPLVDAVAVARPNAVQSPMIASGGQSIRPTGLDLEGHQLAHEVPEYLRGRSRSNWRGLLSICALLILLGMLVLQAIGPWEQVGTLFASRPSVPVHPTENDAASIAQNSTSKSTNDVMENKNPILPSKDHPTENKAQATKDDNDSATSVQPTSSSQEKTASPNDSQQTANTSKDNPTASADVPLDKDKSDAPPLGDANVTAVVRWTPANHTAHRALVLSKQDIDEPFQRVAPDKDLFARWLITPPATETSFDLAGQMNWTTRGPTIMQVDRPNNNTVPVVHLSMGRAIIAAGSQARKLQLVTSNWSGIVNLQTPNGLGAIEFNYRTTAHDRLTSEQAVQPVLTIVAIDGSMSLQPTSGHEIPAVNQDGELILEIGEGVSVVGTAPASKFTLKQVLPWYRGLTDRQIDIQAADDLGRLVTADGDIVKELVQTSHSRRAETSAMATQVLCMLGDWTALARTNGILGNAQGRSQWTNTLDLARQLIARDKAQADRLREAFISSNLTQGDLWTELVLGPSAQQLAEEGLDKLVQLLESDSQIARVLAFYQLKRLTGQDHAYQAASPSRSSVTLWRRELANKRLKIIPPSSSPLFEAATQ